MNCPTCQKQIHEVVVHADSEVWGCDCGYEVIFKDGEVFFPPESPVSETRPQWDDDLIGVVSGSCYIDMDHLAAETIDEIKRDLSLYNMQKDTALRLFTEMGNDLVVPRDYGLRKLGMELFHNNMSMGDKANLEFIRELDPKRQQPRIVSEILENVKPGRGGIAQAVCGSGKCLGAGTTVIKADGSVVPVEQIQQGDRLMGPDGTARNVVTTTRGRGALYEIKPIKGEPWVCNDVHVLTLVNMNTSKIVDVGLDAWFTTTKSFRWSHKLFSVGISSFEKTPAPTKVDPYFLGVWFGDGTKRQHVVAGSAEIATVSITKPDPEIRALCEATALEWGLKVRVDGAEGDPTYHLVNDRGAGNPLLTALRQDVGSGIVIPDAILRGTIETRRQFLAGFLDADGEQADSCFVITQKRTDWARAAWWLARSIGLCAIMTSRKARDQNGTEGVYAVVSISGHTDQIPTRIPRKQAAPRRQRKTATRTGFTATSIGDGDYYGFTLDGDGRFLLGDFTVTHNTVMGLYCAAQWKRSTLILVHSEFLGEQWLKAIKLFLGLDPAEVGWVQGDRCDYKHPITIAMVESLALAAREKREDYSKDFYLSFGTLLADEVHRYAADTWHLAVGRFPAAYRLGLSATPTRADKMEEVIFKHFGPLVSETAPYQIVPEIFMVMIETELNEKRYRKWENGHLTDEIKLSKLITLLAQDSRRNDMLAFYIANALKSGRKLIALSDRLDQLDDVMSRVNEKMKDAPPVLSKFIGGMKQAARKEAVLAQGIFGTYSLAAEGLDIPDLDTLVMLTPRSNVEQSVGRILRECAGKKAPFVVDIVDSIDLCRILGRKRARFYLDRGWQVTYKEWL